jgi:hypothetical protein
MGRRSERERQLLVAAKARLDSLDFYPTPVSLRHVRVFCTPWLFKVPGFRRFYGYELLGTFIFVRRPLDQVGSDLVTHELTHIWQHQHRPAQMVLSYVWQGYRANEHEIEAREAVRLTS